MRVQQRPQSAPRSPQGSRPITGTATEARQGQIVLGPRARWVWIGAFVVLIGLAIRIASG